MFDSIVGVGATYECSSEARANEWETAWTGDVVIARDIGNGKHIAGEVIQRVAICDSGGGSTHCTLIKVLQHEHALHGDCSLHRLGGFDVGAH